MSKPGTTPVTIVVMGVSGSGKSTVLNQLHDCLGWPAAEGDEFHPPANIEKMRAGHPLTDADRWPWLDAVAAWIGEREAAGSSALVTCSALKRAYRDRLRRDHPSVWFAQLAAPAQVIADRVVHRVHPYMPPSLLGSQLDTLEPLEADEPGAKIPSVGTAQEVVDHLLARLEEDRPGSLSRAAG
jgi:gluconokinase